MKHLLFLPLFLLTSLTARCQTPTLVNVLAHLVKCAAATPAFLMWTGTTFSCIALGPGFTLNAGILNVNPTATLPIWLPETVSLATLPTTATSISYTTTKPPINGAVLYWYNSSNPFLSSSGAVPFTGQPLTFTLPTGWTATDTITVLYQSQ